MWILESILGRMLLWRILEWVSNAFRFMSFFSDSVLTRFVSLLSLQCNAFRFLSFRFVSFRFVSIRFQRLPFRFVSFR